MTIYSIEGFRELLSTRSERAMTTLRRGPDAARRFEVRSDG